MAEPSLLSLKLAECWNQTHLVEKKKDENKDIKTEGGKEGREGGHVHVSVVFLVQISLKI